MKDSYRQFSQECLIFAGAVGVGLLAAWLVLKFQKPEGPEAPSIPTLTTNEQSRSIEPPVR